METAKNSKANLSWIITPAEAETRAAVLETLRRSGAMHCLYPTHVDLALGRGPANDDLSALCRTIATSTDGQYRVSEEELIHRIATGDRGPLRGFAVRVALRNIRRLKIPVASWWLDDAVEIVENQILDLLPGYQASGSDSDGQCRSYGWEAYLWVQTLAVRRKIFKMLKFRRSLVDILPRNCAQEIPSAEGIDEDILRKQILEALRQTLYSGERWEFFYRNVYRRETLRDYATRTGQSRSSVSRKVTQLIIEELQQRCRLFLRNLQLKPANFGRIAGILRTVIREEEFLRVVPKPGSFSIPVMGDIALSALHSPVPMRDK